MIVRLVLKFFVVLSVLAGAVFAAPAQAAPSTYVLDPDRSSVNFTWFLRQAPMGGQIGISEAALSVDLERVAQSAVQVTLDVGTARAGFALATSALRGPGMFDAEHHPHIRFVSNQVVQVDGRLLVDGWVSIRGVTRPMRLQAELPQRPRPVSVGGAAPWPEAMTVDLQGAINRHDFGASAWASDVGPMIRIRIQAHLTRTR